MLKRYFYSILFAGLFPTLVAAQEPGPHEKAGEQQTLVERLTHGKTSVENAEMNFQIFTTANAEFRDREFEGANFKLNRVRMEIKGDVGKYLTYYYRQSFNKYMDPFSLDNLSSSLELACVNLNLSDRFSITAGKHFLVLGGYEYYVNAIKVREFSEFNEMISCYQAGLTANWQITPTQELCVQVMNNRSGSDDEIYQTGLPLGVESAKVPFFYSANWPIFICVVMGFYKESAATATSVIIVLQGLLTLPLSYILGVLNEYCGKFWAYRLTLAFCVIAAVCLSCVFLCQKRKERREGESKSEVNVEMVEVKKEEVKGVEKENEKENEKEEVKVEEKGAAKEEVTKEEVNVEKETETKQTESTTTVVIPSPTEL